MPAGTRAENTVKAQATYTSGVGVFNIAGVGSVLHSVVWDTSGIASGHWTSILDTVSGTAASGLWLAVSGVKTLAMNTPVMLSGHSTDPVVVNYGGIIVNSGLAVVISGGAANAVRALVVFSE